VNTVTTAAGQEPRARWIDANQRYLAAEFARLTARLGGEDEAPATEAIDEARSFLTAPAAIDQLAGIFDLSGFERAVLLLCAGVEMDRALASRCAAIDGSRPHVSFALAIACLADPHWSAVAPIGPLRLWRLIEVKDDQAIATSRLAIDERVLHFLAGINYLDPRLRPLLRLHPVRATLPQSHARIVDEAADVLDARSNAAVVQLLGEDRAGHLDVASAAAARLGLQLHVLRASDIPSAPYELEALATIWHREAALLQSALLVACHDASGTAVATRFAQWPHGVLFISTRESIALERSSVLFPVDRPNAPEQKQLWVDALGPEAARLNGSLDVVSTHFRLSADTIARTAEEIRGSLGASASPDAILWRACRASFRSGLDDLAERIEPVARWNDLVLPEAQTTSLRQMAAHVRQRLRVYEEWGFARRSGRGLGISALFAGESGTGKTMAAEVMANELELSLYRIDLSAVVSKYIGATEKNLRRVFDAAEDSGAILLFDEADALFGKRSDVKDSHDRYANIEVSYLLQRMEAYRGLAILTTNMKSALDPAFQRRLRFVVQFPFPDQRQREQIWRGMFPSSVPLDAVDSARLARLNVTGGHIRNIALNAAFLAADAGVPIRMSHLLDAARADAAKRDRPLADAETRGWV